MLDERIVPRDTVLVGRRRIVLLGDVVQKQAVRQRLVPVRERAGDVDRDRIVVADVLRERLAALTVELYRAFCDADALMLEVNPLAVTIDGIAIVGAMMEIDDCALGRHPVWREHALTEIGPSGRALNERELTGGNGMVEMGTFVAILLGNLAGGLIVAIPEIGHQSVAAACVAAAVLGRLIAQFIPPAASWSGVGAT